MKTALLLAVLLSAFQGGAQTTTTPAPAAPRVTAPPSVTIPNRAPNVQPAVQNPVPGQVTAPVQSQLQPLTGQTNNLAAAGATNSAVGGMNAGLGNLQQMLENLQVNIQQVLPSLMELSGERPAVPNTTAPANTQTPALPATGTANPRRLANGAIVGNLGTNGFAMNPLTYRQVRVLTYELNEALPLLQALNGSATLGLNSGMATPEQALAGGFTNRFTPLVNGTGTISPTGR